MKKSVNKILAGLMAVSLLAGCGANSQSASENQSPAVTQGGAQNGSGDSHEEEEVVLPEYIEFQRDNPGFLPVEKDGQMYNFYKDILGFS